MENKITYTVTVNNKGGSEAETILAETVAYENNKLEVVLRILEDWLSKAESYRDMALDDPTHLRDEVTVTIEVELDEDELDEVEYQLNCFIDDDDCEPAEIEKYDQDVSLATKITYDREFSETYKYENGVLRISTGFEERYVVFAGDDDPFELDKDNFLGAIEACERGVFWEVLYDFIPFKDWHIGIQNRDYYQDLMETGWDPEAEIK